MRQNSEIIASLLPSFVIELKCSNRSLPSTESKLHFTLVHPHQTVVGADEQKAIPLRQRGHIHRGQSGDDFRPSVALAIECPKTAAESSRKYMRRGHQERV